MLEHRESNEANEPRRGVAPFAGGLEMQDDNFIITKPIVFGDLGKVSIWLFKAQPGDITQPAFTIDLSGKVIRGKVIDFYKQEYYQVGIQIQRSKDLPILDQLLKANIWLENTEQTVTTDFITTDISEDIDVRAYFLEHIRSVYENFMLPNNPKILQAVRLNITNN